MEHHFESKEWAELSPTDRAKRCRFMAREAAILADGAPVILAESYLKIAEQWLALADEIEKHARV